MELRILLPTRGGEEVGLEITGKGVTTLTLFKPWRIEPWRRDS